jgi:hypothetical protein
MPLTAEERARFEAIRDEGLKYVDRQATVIEDANKALKRAARRRVRA